MTRPKPTTATILLVFLAVHSFTVNYADKTKTEDDKKKNETDQSYHDDDSTTYPPPPKINCNGTSEQNCFECTMRLSYTPNDEGFKTEWKKAECKQIFGSTKQECAEKCNQKLQKIKDGPIEADCSCCKDNCNAKQKSCVDLCASKPLDEQWKVNDNQNQTNQTSPGTDLAKNFVTSITQDIWILVAAVMLLLLAKI